MALFLGGELPFTGRQIAITISRIEFLEDRAVVKLGLKHLGQILEKRDLSENEALKSALLKVMSAHAALYPTLGNDTKI